MRGIALSAILLGGCPWVLGGCPWVTSPEHKANQRLWLAVDNTDTGDTDTDTDTDTDADTDTDTDADTDTDTDVGPCNDDGFESNDVLADATFLFADYPIDAVLCANDDGLGGEPTDVFEVVQGATAIADITIQAPNDCADLTLRMELIHGGEVTQFLRPDGACGVLTGGGFAGITNSFVRIVHEGGAAAQPYSLEGTTHTCEDGDGDGVLNEDCGGPDCDDSDPEVFPGAPEIARDQTDQDCNGGDLLESCSADAMDAPVNEVGTLRCGNAVSEGVWDVWTVPAVMSDCVAVQVDNLGLTASDPLVRLRDEDGNGLDLDNETPCAGPTWTSAQLFPFDQQCPGGDVGVVLNGDLEIWIAQVNDPGGQFCPDNAPYGLSVTVGGVEVAPTLLGDNVLYTP